MLLLTLKGKSMKTLKISMSVVIQLVFLALKSMVMTQWKCKYFYKLLIYYKNYYSNNINN